jgi:hypothetical protein
MLAIRRWLTLAVFLVLPLGASQIPVVQDPVGDVAFGPDGSPAMAPGPWHVDILALAVGESDDAFTVAIDLVPLAEPRVAPSDLDVFFTSGQSTFWVQLLAPATLGGAGALYRGDAAGWVFVDALEVVQEEARWTATVPKVFLVSDAGAPPAAGDRLTEFWASARAAGANAGEAEAALRDRAPDRETAGEFEVSFGPSPRGGARIFSTTPSRVSNGEEATFAYEVTVQNNGGLARDFVLEVVRKPLSWAIDLPTAAVHLQPGESLATYAFISTPFAHQHGRLESAQLALRSVDGEAEDRVDLYLLYHAVPQPAGHHDTLWLHVDDAGQSPVNQLAWNSGGAFTYMNTLEQDEQDVGSPALGRAITLGGEGYGWDFVLHPMLRTGLDFDLERTGRLALTLSSPVPVTEATFEGRLVLQREPELELASVTPQTGISLMPGSPVSLDLELLAAPGADFVPYNGSTPVVLELALRSDRPATYSVPESPSILPGGLLSLPLLEYRDPLDVQALAVPENGLAVEGPAQKRVQAGATAVFTLAVQADVDRLSLVGTNTDWAEVVRRDATVYVVVQAPEGASDLQTADLVLKAERGGSVVGLARLIMTVSPDATTDDSDLAAGLEGGEARGSPALTPLAGALALAIAAVVVRRNGRRGTGP